MYILQNVDESDVLDFSQNLLAEDAAKTLDAVF